MKRTGERLKASREEQKLTISEVSLSTKINPRVLQAMEAGQLEKLPAISFLRGFIRTYASFLKLDGNELLELFSEELEEKKQSLEEDGAETPEEAPAPWHQSVPLLKDSSVTSRSLAAGGVVLLIIVILGIKNLVDKYEREG
ncbi:MAG: helix-turn-helix domain-containing protein, partial [Bdellovibrionales bacterium]|nr:helix-turn-helix domain-containing protein [Bdellovibrionales bacterium]